VQLAVLGTGPVIPHSRTGRLELLAQTTDARSPLLPDVPTCQEAGFKALSIEQWQGVFFPAGTPPEIVARLQTEIVKALAEPKVRKRFAQNGLEAVGNTREQFAAVVRRDYEKYGRLVRELKITID
jgi:tripartite-type tricarboxylate transporter receptor subunit TctC